MPNHQASEQMLGYLYQVRYALAWMYSRRTQRAFGTAMRSCASLSRGVAAPLGRVIFFTSVEIAASTPCAQDLSACAR